jgi:hypothetical protein
MFEKTSAVTSTAGIARLALPVCAESGAAFMYGGATDFKLSHHVFVRAEYRGFVCDLPARMALLIAWRPPWALDTGSNGLSRLVLPSGRRHVAPPLFLGDPNGPITRYIRRHRPYRTGPGRPNRMFYGLDGSPSGSSKKVHRLNGAELSRWG